MSMPYQTICHVTFSLLSHIKLCVNLKAMHMLHYCLLFPYLLYGNTGAALHSEKDVTYLRRYLVTYPESIKFERVWIKLLSCPVHHSDTRFDNWQVIAHHRHHNIDIMVKLRFGIKTVYFPFLLVFGILIGTFVLSGMPNCVIRSKPQILLVAYGVTKIQQFLWKNHYTIYIY